MDCDAAAFRAKVRAMGGTLAVPSRKGTRDPQPCSGNIYRPRTLIERCWSRLKERSAAPTRYNKTCICYAAGGAIAASPDWIKALLQ